MGKSILNWADEFVDLPCQVKDAIARRSIVRTYSNNSVIYLQEDDAKSIHFVVSGYVRLSYLMEDGTAILYSIVPPGHSFGELAVLDRGRYPDTASAVGTTQVLSAKPELIGGNYSGHDEVQVALSKLVMKRYRTYIDATKGLFLKTLQARLALSLLRLVDTLAETTKYCGAQKMCLGPSVNQSDLGAMARGTRGNINRILKSWQSNNWIAIERRKIIILDRQSLLDLTYEDQE